MVFHGTPLALPDNDNWDNKDNKYHAWQYPSIYYNTQATMSEAQKDLATGEHDHSHGHGHQHANEPQLQHNKDNHNSNHDSTYTDADVNVKKEEDRENDDHKGDGDGEGTDNDDDSGPGSTNWNIIKNPSNGRTRISQACDRCRARKIKCSGKSETNPKCTNCEKDGFPCVVSDKLTRNSFPKGYTKNLEKKLLDVELSRNQLVLELNNLKQKLAMYESSHDKASSMFKPTAEFQDLASFNNTSSQSQSMRVEANRDMTIDKVMLDTLAYGYNRTLEENDTNEQSKDFNNVGKTSDQNTGVSFKSNNDVDYEMTENSSGYGNDNERDIINNHLSRNEAYYNKKVATNDDGILILDQNLVSPFESIFASLKSKTFKGYSSSTLNASSGFAKPKGSSISSATSSNPDTSRKNSSKAHTSYIKDDLSPVALKQLTNYHMNLNRYLNLILYKLIFPLFNLDSNTSGLESNKNLDHLIWLFFNDYNKLIPILDFELFYNDYLNFVNTYTLKTSTYSDNGEIKKRYYEFNTKDQDTLIKLILVLKFTLCQPKINDHDTSSAFLPDKTSLNQLDESLKLINIKHIIFMFRNINFCLYPNLDKLEISLLLFYYLIKFENYNLTNYTDTLHSHKEFLLDIININKNLVHTLSINKPNELLVAGTKPKDKPLVEIQRLKLYWNYKILIKLTEVYFNIPLVSEECMSMEERDPSKPASLESILLVNNDIHITLCLVKLLMVIPWNVMEFVNDKNMEVLKKIDQDLTSWREAAEKLYNEENTVVFNKLKSYYLYFKVLVNINGKIDSSYFIDFIDLVYDLTFSSPKSTKKSCDISIEAAENLCLHSFNFHLVTLIAITSLQYVKDRTTCQKIYKLIQLYQILINYKDVDPLITMFVNYIKDNIMFSFSDANTIQDDTLKLFSSIDVSKVNSKSLFDKKVPYRRAKGPSFSMPSAPNAPTAPTATKPQNGFDLNAFNLPGDSMYSNEDLSIHKRRRSNESAISFMSSNASIMSRESSLVSSSRRLSGSSNDSAHSLFASATSPHQNPPTLCNDITSSAKKRIMDYAIQPSRTMHRSRSLSNDSKLRSSRVSERRPSNPHNSFGGGFQISRDNSVDPMNKTFAVQLTDDEMISHILQSDMESEADSDLSVLGNSKGRSSNFKPNTNLLPTIPSEGNLMKIMESLSPSVIEPLKKAVSAHVNNTTNPSAGFNIGCLFSNTSNYANDHLNTTNTMTTPNSYNNFMATPDSAGFAKAFRKSPNSLNSAYQNGTSTSSTGDDSAALNPVTVSSNILSPEKAMIDNDDLMRLKEHVMSLKSSIQQ